MREGCPEELPYADNLVLRLLMTWGLPLEFKERLSVLVCVVLCYPGMRLGQLKKMIWSDQRELMQGWVDGYAKTSAQNFCYRTQDQTEIEYHKELFSENQITMIWSHRKMEESSWTRKY